MFERQLKVYQAMAQAVALYACETWAISLETVSCIEGFAHAVPQ